MTSFKKNSQGQSAVEFVLLAPLLFFIFFAIVQLAYMSYAALAVQRGALSVARDVALDGQDDPKAVKARLILSLLPLAQLNQKTLLTVLESKCESKISGDRKQITVQVHYPMPIWVPMVRNIIGESLVPSADYNNSPEGEAVKAIFQMLDKTPPNLSFKGARFPVVWMKCEATTFNEAEGR